MNLNAILTKLKQKQLKISLDEKGALKLRGNQDNIDKELVLELQQNKQELIALLKANSTELRPKISKTAYNPAGMALSYAQQRLWFIDKMDVAGSQYNMPTVFRVNGDFDIEAAENALLEIIQRHEPLRTTFKEVDNSPVQIVQPEVEFKITQHDLSDLRGDMLERRLNYLVDADQNMAFDLANDLMIRCSYLILSGESDSKKGVLLFNMHHIAADGWSMGILIKEFVTIYRANVEGSSYSLPTLDIQYADYASWQRNWLADKGMEQQISYWQKHLEGVPVVHSLPLDYSRPAIKAHQGGSIFGTIEADNSELLKKLALDKDVTLFMLIHAGLVAVLSRHANTSDLVIATPMANRMQAELEPLIGFFINTLVLRTNSELSSFDELLTQVKQVNLDAQLNQDVPFEHLVDCCKVPRSIQHTPLAQIMFTMTATQESELELPQVELLPFEASDPVAKFDLEISVQDSDKGLFIKWTYDKSIFKQKTIERLNEHLENILIRIATASELSTGIPDMMSASERDYLLTDLNQTDKPHQDNLMLHESFERKVLEFPDKLSLIMGAQEVTYSALNSKANQLAHYLRETGVSLDEPVGICLHRSQDLFVTILAVLKAGGAYLPIDPDYPEKRINKMLKDSGIKKLICLSELKDKLTLEDKQQAILLNEAEFSHNLAQYSEENLARTEQQNPSNLAYVIYTSGSTGEPKGVMVEHRNVTNVIEDNIERFKLDASSRMLHNMSISFDAASKSLWVTLLSGATLVIVDSEYLFDEKLESYIDSTNDSPDDDSVNSIPVIA